MKEIRYSRIALLGFALGIGALVAAMSAGLGYRADFWPYRTGFSILRVAAWTGLGGAAIALVGCFLATRPGRRGVLLGAIGLIAGVLAYGVPSTELKKVRFLPVIHDVTTDTENPPAFIAALPIRQAANAANSTEYGGKKIADLQKKSYPDIVTQKRAESREAVFQRALEIVRGSGWEILAEDPNVGRIEATDTTFWFGFKDDIVIRVRADGPNSALLDIRSISRVGRSDAGANAARIRNFIRELNKAG